MISDKSLPSLSPWSYHNSNKTTDLSSQWTISQQTWIREDDEDISEIREVMDNLSGDENDILKVSCFCKKPEDENIVACA